MSRLVLVVLILPLVLLISWLAAPQKQLLEEQLSEQRWLLAPQTQPEERFIILTLDEKSLQQLGAWPWSRTTLAQLSAKLQAAGAATQIFDLILPEAKPGDTQLAQQLSNSNSLLGILPALNNHQTLQTGLLGKGLSGISCNPPLAQTNNYLGNAPAYQQQNVGHLTPLVSPDGVIRQQPPIICVNGKAYPSLTLAALLANTQPASQLTLKAGKGLMQPNWWLTSNNGLKLPLNAQGNLRLSYHQAPQNFIRLSAADLLNNNYPPQLLNNAWVLIGATAFGLADVVPTPHAPLTPGVELQARLLSDLLDQNHTYQPQGAWLYQLLQLLASSALLLVLAAHRQHNVTLLAAAALALPTAQLLMHWALLPLNLWVGWLTPALFGSLAASALLLLEFARTRLERLRLYQNLSSYLPKDIADQIAFSQPSGLVEAKTQTLVVVYADLRNFPAWQEHLSAEETAALLHYFFVTANQTLAKHGGTLHEFRGDAILAAWPTTPANQAAQIQNALNLIAELQNTMHTLLESTPQTNLEPLGLDFALDLGPVLVGSLGSTQRRSHLLLGKTITRAISIQKLTQDIGSTLLLSETAAQTLPATQTKSQGNFLLEGFTRPRQLYTLKKANPQAQQNPTNQVLQLHPQSR